MLADHSDRSGSATFLLKEIIAQDLSQVVVATIADAKATAKLKADGAKAGDAFDMEIGGLVDESAGDPVRITGTILNAVEGHGQFWVVVKFGRDNVLILSTYLVQIMEPFGLRALGLDLDAFKAFAIKSRVHFRKGFDDNGFAKTILLVEPDQPFLGTVHLDALPYRNVDLKKFYPYGEVEFHVRLGSVSSSASCGRRASRCGAFWACRAQILIPPRSGAQVRCRACRPPPQSAGRGGRVTTSSRRSPAPPRPWRHQTCRSPPRHSPSETRARCPPSPARLAWPARHSPPPMSRPPRA